MRGRVVAVKRRERKTAAFMSQTHRRRTLQKGHQQKGTERRGVAGRRRERGKRCNVRVVESFWKRNNATARRERGVEGKEEWMEVDCGDCGVKEYMAGACP